jgi:DNA-binding NarL/FixJ family response regulator
MPTDVLILVAAKPGVLRDGFQAVLAAIPRTKVIDPVDNSASALRAVAEHQPALILLDTNLPDYQVWTLLEQIKTQQQTAQAADADGVLIKGCSAREFYATINKLLPQHDPSTRSCS